MHNVETVYYALQIEDNGDIDSINSQIVHQLNDKTNIILVADRAKPESKKLRVEFYKNFIDRQVYEITFNTQTLFEIKKMEGYSVFKIFSSYPSNTEIQQINQKLEEVVIHYQLNKPKVGEKFESS